MKLDPETRARIVQEWMAAPSDQKSFCAARSISPRTLRAWCQHVRAEDGHVEQDRHAAAVQAALEALQVRLGKLEAAVAAALGSAAACRAAVEHPDPTEAGPCLAGEAELPPAPGPAEAVVPTPVADVVPHLPAEEQRLVTSKAGSDATTIPSPAPRKRGSFFRLIEDEVNVPS
jgi:transposase-like protein